jgi:hypothetical protein
VSTSIFSEKTPVPDGEMLTGVLKGSKALWDDIKDHVASTCGNASEEWKYYSKKAGWILVVKSGKRTILYLIPLDSSFKANYVFGEKATAAAMTAGLPKHIIAQISEAKVHMEGRSFMIDIATKEEANVAKKLIDIKSKN